MQPFVELLTHSSSTIRPYIRSLELLSSSPPRGSDSYDSDWLDLFIATLASLPSVSEILIQNIVWGRMNPSTRSALLAGFQALTHLEIRAAQFDSVNHLVQLVSSKPVLQILSVDDLGWQDPSFDDAQWVSGALHSVRLSNCYKRDIFDWLASHDPLPPIKHIQLGSVYPEDTHSIGRFLRRLGAHLLTLQLEFSSLDAGGDAGIYSSIYHSITDSKHAFPEDFCARVDLTHNSALHTIILDKFINYSVYQFSSAVEWIPELLSRIPNLMEVSFGVAIRDLGELHPQEDPIDWDTLDSLFCHPRFPHLRTLWFWVSGTVALDAVSAAIARCLPRSSERRLLRFHRGVPGMVE